MPAKSRQSPIEKVEHAGSQNKGDRLVVEHPGRQALRREKRSLKNAQRRRESAEEVSCRHQVRQQVDFGFVGGRRVHWGN